MSEFKGTPGPWHLEKQNPDAQFTLIGGPIAIVGGHELNENSEFIIGESHDFGPHGDMQVEANAQLIAAAPELLEACQRFNEYFKKTTVIPRELNSGLIKIDDYIGFASLVESMRKSIAKATGSCQ